MAKHTPPAEKAAASGYDPEITQTQEWDLERPILVEFTRDETCRIICGGVEMPRYTAEGDTLPDAIADLVQQVTRDAIADEAREWRNRE